MQNSLTLTAGNAVTMSSREIAELVGSRHDDVKRSIERLVQRGVIVQPPSADEHSEDALGRTRITSVYDFSGEQGKRDSIIVVAQLCPEFTAALVDRWRELESGLSAVALPDFSNPVAAARAWADAKEAEQKSAAALELAKPKVDFFDKVVERATLMTATQVAQKIGMSALAMNKMLDALDVYSKNVKRARVFKQWFIDKGYGELKQTELGYSQPLFTTAGEAWVIERLVSEGAI